MIFAGSLIRVFGIGMTFHMADGTCDSVILSDETYMYFSDPENEITRLRSPVNGASNTSVFTEFSWQDVSGETFELLVSDNSEFEDTILYVDDLDTNIYHLTDPLEIRSLYYWKVRINGKPTWTAPWSFRTYSPTLPAKIGSFACLPGGESGTIELSVADPAQIDSFLVLLSFDGATFSDSTYCDSINMLIGGLDPDSCYYIKIAGVNLAGVGELSDMLAATPGERTDPMLIVNGFDRQTTGNTYDYIRQHAAAVTHLGYAVASATNEALTAGLIDLREYKTVAYILGEESTADETFSNAEQDLVEAYLKTGGSLFVSGAEIAWDLDYKGSSSDKAFCHNYLHLAYVQDAPNNATGTYYQVHAEGDTIFSELGAFSFDNGTHGTYNVRYPDVFTPLNDAQSCMKYTGCNTGSAGIVYEGIFPGGSETGKIMVLGFPFETIYPEAARASIMKSFIDFSEDGLAVEYEAVIPETHGLLPNYPNPFNPLTHIAYRLCTAGKVELEIVDLSGRKIGTLVHGMRDAGTYSVTWDASKIASGIYVSILKVDGLMVDSKKMLLVK